jgi:hypothetical protein
MLRTKTGLRSRFWEGHGFSRAVESTKNGRASAPEGSPRSIFETRFKFIGTLALALAILAMLQPACSVNVKKESDGEDKQVDISTPIGGIHVSKGADAADTGLPVYPGARLKPEDSNGDDKSANVNISGFGYGIKVVALEFESDDSPAKIVAFYKEPLKKYGSILECHTSVHLDVSTNLNDGSNIHLNVSPNLSHDSDNNSHVLTCSGKPGNNVELRVGTEENQHIVAVEPEGKGSSFSLVYVRTHGKDADI